jgi:hypothetical protein
VSPSSDFAVIAGGPSLTKADAELARMHCTIVGVNDAYRIVDCDYLYASDYEWWNFHADAVRNLPCVKVAGKQKDKTPPEFCEVWDAEHGADLTRPVINYGKHSGFAALHLAILLGAKRVFLLGYDAKVGKRVHWFGKHPQPLRNTGNYNAWAALYGQTAHPVPIINCSRETAITAFPRMTIEEVF